MYSVRALNVISERMFWGMLWRRIWFIISVIDRGRIHFDREQIHFDHGQIHFDQGRIHFDRGRIHFDRGRIHFKSHTSANHKASYKDPVYLCM